MKGIGGIAAAIGMGAVDWGMEPGYSVDHRGKRVPKSADPKKKAKRKAQQRARKINRKR